MLVQMLRSLALGLVASTLAAQGAPTVLTVDDDDPTADFDNLQAAIDAAPQAGVILVGAGTYGGYTIDGKSLSVLADPPGAAVFVNAASEVRITGIGAGQRVVLRGLRQGATADSSGIFLGSSTGTLWLEDSSVTGITSALRVFSCEKVILQNCDVEGPLTQYGLIASRSGLHVYDSRITGGGTFLTGGTLGCFMTPGARLFETGLFAQDSTFAGGDSDSDACNGAPALEVVASDLFLRNVQTLAGNGQDPTPPIDMTFDSSIQEVAGVTRSLTTVGTVRAGVTSQVDFQGASAEIAALVVAPSPGLTLLPGLDSGLALGTPFSVSLTTTLDAQGQASLTVTAPPMLGVPTMTLYLQSAFLDPSGTPGDNVRLGSPSALTLLEAGT